MACLPVNIAMILGHQDLTLGEVSDSCNGVISPLQCAVNRRWSTAGGRPARELDRATR